MHTLFRASLVLVVLVTQANAEELLPYQAQGWKYAQVQWGDPLSQTFFDPSFDDGTWPTGTAAFGITTCPVDSTLQTPWDPNTDLLLRRPFSAAIGEPVTLYWAVDNDATVYVNGVVVADVQYAWCPNLDDYMVVVPPSVLVPGVNILAVKAHDYGFGTYFDLRIDGTSEPVSTAARTWGLTKAAYRIAPNN
ncbi:hypothetical protein K8I85_15760 [bacterium]|nr:hypothetical protein [bacterium]